MYPTVTITSTSGDYINRKGAVKSGNFWKVQFDGITVNYPGSYTKTRVLELVLPNVGFDAMVVWN